MRRQAATPDGLSRRSLLCALPATLATAASLRARAADGTPLQRSAAAGVALSGVYPGHLQGVCADDRDALYWSMTTDLVKTDAAGKIMRKIAVPSHHGDLCHVDGRIYVAVNRGPFNDPQKRADSWIYIYDADDLSLLDRRPVPELVYGAGGVAFGEGRFIVVGGLPGGAAFNTIYEYDRALRFTRSIVLNTAPTYKGVQTAAFDGDHWWFGCYGRPDFTEVLIRTDRRFGALQRFAFDASTGVVPLDRETLLVARSACGQERCVARLAPVKLNAWIREGRLKPV